MSCSVITPEIRASLEAWKIAFATFWSARPEEFFFKWRENLDLFRRDITGHVNPVRTEWFQELVKKGTTEDLDAVYAALSTRSGMYFHVPYGYQEFFMYQVLWAADDARLARPVKAHSIAIPKWFRSRYIGIGCLWQCEIDEKEAKAKAKA